MDRASTPPSGTALVVDDEVLIRLHAADLLGDKGFEVLEARDAQEAISLMEARPDVRLLFTDMQMPGRDGLDLAREIHARWPHVLLIIASSGKAIEQKDIPDDGRFLAKPYSSTQLNQRIDTVTHERSPKPLDG